MDLVIGRGARFFYLLVPKSPKLFSKLPLFVKNQNKVAAYWHVHYFGKHLSSSCQSSYINALANHDRQFEQFSIGSCLPKTSKVQYSISAKPKTIPDKSATPDEDCKESPSSLPPPPPPPTEKPSIFQRMKQMTKDYWHILIPVHVVTSIGWASMFYIAAKNGVDIVGIMESLNLSEKYLEMMRGSNAGHWAVTYALYKVFTPIRYTVTVGGTTMTIRYLNKWGIMKFKTDSKLSQSLKSAKDHVTSYGKSTISKINKSQPPKT